METTYTLTAEQEQALDLFSTGQHLVIEAGAGTGKTSTLITLAESTDRIGQYLAFNKALVEDAKLRFPTNVAVSTIHSLANRSVRQSHPAIMRRLNKGRLSRTEEARILGIDRIVVQTADGPKPLAAGYLAAHVLEGIKFFCQSDATEPSERHFPTLDRLDVATQRPDGSWTHRGPVNREIAKALTPALRRAWSDLTSEHGRLRFLHEHYLKMWELTNPVIDVDFILFDEAQDVSPVMRSIVLQQASRSQLVFVGDSQQAIYGFTGARNAMTFLDGERTFLTQSFRFGPAVAEVANVVLTRIDQTEDAPLRLKGFDSIESAIGSIEEDALPDALLCRTNATAVAQAIRWMAEGHKVAVAENLRTSVTGFAKGSIELREDGWTKHHELNPFRTWGEVQDFVAFDPAGGDLKLLVDLVDEFGAEVIIDEMNRTVSENKADVIVTTAHTSKGREWNRVKLAADFGPRKNRETGDEIEPSVDDLRLLYVAVTRAKLLLDCSAVRWVTSGDEVDEA